ncbi:MULTISPECIES: GNAT family protein [unclassified Streptomyces]|uniref:GNAT family N-acetyltransferase n=1 Tax=unclassified Streptomyces TaxID=2593676 RepID=UPI002E0D2C3D|nr:MULTISPECIES: GNAT family protein [unclassified Streptomyces]WSQ89228.1 GNAT family N-acetyltransferase [Streptomyces sp. NBC_01212]WSR04765.1 GNAT family N-acetyltransferase [Streptomyces sp. NBC_01208]
MNDMWTGGKVRLRGVEPEDWKGFRDLARNTADARAADQVEPPRSDESFRSWTAERARRPPGGEAFRLVVEVLADPVFAGTVTVGETDNRAGRFRTGIEISRDHRGKGYATEATELILTYMFGEQRLNKCEVEVYAFNEASLALHRKLGFVDEGRLRQHQYFAGGYHDMVLLGITADEFWATHGRPSVR